MVGIKQYKKLDYSVLKYDIFTDIAYVNTKNTFKTIQNGQ